MLRLMMRVRRPAALVLAVTTLACTGLVPAPTIDMSTNPRVVFGTDDFSVGTTYTFGHGIDPAEVGATTPIQIEEVSIVHANGVEVIGVGAFAPGGGGAPGLVEGWPPATATKQVVGADLPSAEWSGPVAILIGMQTTAERSGFRGVRVVWREANGERHVDVSDVAAVHCAPPGCQGVESERLLIDLGLVGESNR